MKNLNFFSNMNPQYLGVLFILIGIFLMIMAVTDPEWFFGDTKTFNVQKIQGWVNLFGRNITRIVVGFMAVCLIAFGIFWIWAYRQ